MLTISTEMGITQVISLNGLISVLPPLDLSTRASSRIVSWFRDLLIILCLLFFYLTRFEVNRLVIGMLGFGLDEYV